MTDTSIERGGAVMPHSTDEEEAQYPSRDSLRSATPIIVPTMTDSQRNNTAVLVPSINRDATTPVVSSPHGGAEKLVPLAPTVIEEALNVKEEDGGTTEVKQHITPFSRERRQTRSVRMAQKESSRYRQSKKLWAVAVGDFQGIYGDELTLKAGEKVEIVSKDVRVSRNIGWWTGRNERGRYGIFPEGCIKILNKESEDKEFNIEIEFPFIISCSDIQLKEVIGVGGFGRVHRAIYKEQEVAVKVAKSTTFDIVKAAQDVVSEAQKFQHLAHVNVCALIGVVLVCDVCLVMEYAQGGALSEVLHKKKLALPLEVILDWSHQIASGVHYLHTEVKPSLIHRDLKSSNILLANQITPSNLYNNTIKITDFGLAREIEHTTQMTGAGTYPWMAPEVIISNDFSTKCDVWSYGVVLWELLTGEKPYGNLNAFVVAYGVGRGTLSLPIPDGCPESFQDLMNACWKKEYTQRPTFSEVLLRLKEIEREEFVTSTTLNDFLSIQSTWKSEIQEQFLKFKREESAFREQELPGDITKRIKQQEDKISQQQQELEKLRQDTKQAQEEWQKRREKEQAEVFQRQRDELEKLKEKLKEMETRREENPTAVVAQTRPPRVKRFSARRLLKWLSGTDNQKIQQSKQNHHQQQPSNPSSSSSYITTHPFLKHTTSTGPDERPSSATAVLQPPRRTTSFPSTNLLDMDTLTTAMTKTRRPASVADDITSNAKSHFENIPVEKRTSLPNKFRGTGEEGPVVRARRGGTSGGGGGGGLHKRRHSGGNITKSQIEEYGLGDGSDPPPITSFIIGEHFRPFTENMQKMIEGDTSSTLATAPVATTSSRVRSLSHPRSPSPHLLSLVSSPNSPKSPQSASTVHSNSASVASEFDSIKKPSNLTLQNKHASSDESNPNSPSTGIDSGKESDFSNQSVMSSGGPSDTLLHPHQHHHLMSFESPSRAKAEFQIAMAFDPLYQIRGDETLQPLRQAPSYDSLLTDNFGGTTSGNVSPCIYSTSPNLKRQTSPRGCTNEQTSPRSSLSITAKDAPPLLTQQLAAGALGAVRNSPIARPRPRPGQLNSYTSDTGPIIYHPHQPRPFSPAQHPASHYRSSTHRKSDISPSGSVQSLIIAGYDSDYGLSGFQSDSDATSTHSSLLDLGPGEENIDDLQPPLVPTPFESIHFEFDLRRF